MSKKTKTIQSSDDFEFDFFKSYDCKYKVFTSAGLENKNELWVQQYVGMYEDVQDHKLGKITDKKYIDIYNNEGEGMCLYHLNTDEYVKLSKYISKQEETSKRCRTIGKTIEANAIDSNLDEPNTWISELCDWFIKNEFDIPLSKEIKLAIYQEFEILFNKFYNDENADPTEVKSILNDKDRWKNPSKYLADAKKKHGLSTLELKQHPGFSWVDPKGTAID